MFYRFIKFTFLGIIGTLFIGGCAKLPPPQVVPKLDLQRYMGTWHEIARLPFRYERNCVGASANYRAINEEEFLITNYCWYKSHFGPMRQAKAEAMVDDPVTRAKFKVQFIWPLLVDYWVLYVSEDYQQAMVGTPDRKYLWILSRTMALAPEIYHDLVQRAKADGFDVSRLIRTPPRQPSAAEQGETR